MGASASGASAAPGRSRRPSSPYAADTRVVDEWLARLGTVKAATRAGGRRQRAPPDRRGALSPAGRRFGAARRLRAARARSVAVPRARRAVVRALRRAAPAAQRRQDARRRLTTDDGNVWRAPSGATVDAANVGAGGRRAVGSARRATFVAAPPAGEPTLRWRSTSSRPASARPTRHVVAGLGASADGCVARLDARRDVQAGARDVRRAPPGPAGD